MVHFANFVAKLLTDKGLAGFKYTIWVRSPFINPLSWVNEQKPVHEC
jgi:hypothetical protein